MGTIYKRGEIWWIKYSWDGKPEYESSKSKKRTDAKKLLKKREGEVVDGKLPGSYFDRVKFEELTEDFFADLEYQKRKSIWRAKISVGHLEKHFGGRRVTQINTSLIKQYINARLSEGKSHATINRELAALYRMLNLAARCTPPKIDRVPHIPKLEEDNVREGFFEHEGYLKIHDALPSPIKPVLTFGYFTGWRKSEILELTWDRVDLKEGTVRIEVGDTKNKGGRTIYLNTELKALLGMQWKQKMRQGYTNCPHVFHRNGKRIKDFRGAWKKACQEVGLEGTLFHDLRRTSVRNDIRAGIPERVAMARSGHKSRSVFDRYNIVSPEDLKQAAAKQDEYFSRATVTKELQSAKNAGVKDSQNQAQVVNIT